MTDALFARLARHVEAGALPGFVALGARGSDVHVAAVGSRTFGDTEPIGRDAIFRLASLTKPIAAVAAMTMIDDGTLSLDATVERWLPELADRRVLRSIESPLDDTVPADRPITVEDVLTYRIGFGSVMAPPDTFPIQTAEAALDLKTLGPPWPPSSLDHDQWIARFATLPLMHQPGREWRYNTSAHVLGVLLERAAGAPLERVLRQRVLDPLAMVDTAFSVPPAEMHRFTTAYAPDPDTGVMRVLDANDATSWWSRPPSLPTASAWLVSTIDDMWSFARMMANGGAHQGRQLLSPASFASMTTDHLTPDQRAASTLFLGQHTGWGLGLAVPAAGDPVPAEQPGFGWDGGTGTSWRTDPASGRTGILLTQRAMTSPEPPALFGEFWDCIADL